MKKNIYLFLWSHILKNIIPRKSGTGAELEDYSERMIEQFNLASLFQDKIDFAIVGDSNGENLATYENMKHLQNHLGLGVNIAIGGTRADSWVDFLSFTPKGLLIQNNLSQTKNIIFNIGGNNILQNRMDVLEKSLKNLKLMFPLSYNCLVPPIHLQFISGFMGLLPEHLSDRIQYCNKLIQDICGSRAIDTYTPFLSSNYGEPYWFVHEDAVHFSDWTNRKIRIPIMCSKVKYGN